jgi:hypothetical protein
VEVQDSIRKMRDFMITINDNILAPQEYASKAETEASIKSLERKLNNIFKMLIQNSLNP